MQGSSIFRTHTVLSLVSIDFDDEHRKSYWFEQARKNKDDILRLAYFLTQNSSIEYIKRIERNQVDIYTNDQDFYERLSKEFVDCLRYRSEPKNPIDDDFILVKSLPHKRFKFKVYLKPHKVKREDKIKYVEWLETQSKKISISHSVKKWFMVTDWNWDRRYMWVEDDSTLLMLKLRNSDAIGTIKTYKIIE